MARSGWSVSSEIRWSLSRGIGGQFPLKSGGQYQRILHFYISGVESDNNTILDDDFKLEVFKQVWANVEDHQTIYADYRLSATIELDVESEGYKEFVETNSAKIASLPLSEDDRAEFIEVANSSFERVFERIEPENPEIVRSLWNAELYIDNELLREEMLPIDRDYALSLIDAFLFGYVIQLAVQAYESQDSEL